MGRLLQSQEYSIENSDSILSFQWDSSAGGGQRYLTLRGVREYDTGHGCGTCGFLFMHLGEGFDRSPAFQLPAVFRAGILGFDAELLRQLSPIFPVGKYQVRLLTILPYLVKFLDNDDYFQNERAAVWGWSDRGAWWLPRQPNVRYYRGTSMALSETSKFFEFVIPMMPFISLDDDTLDQYRAEIRAGARPTALALSVFDHKQAPQDYTLEPVLKGSTTKDEERYTDHRCLGHFIVDGHHKIFAAACEGKPVTLLSFHTLDHSICTPDDLTMLEEILQCDPLS